MMPIAYTVSSSFSGSTLLSLILNAHPAIATISEFDGSRAIQGDPQYRCSCGERIRECPFFVALTKKLTKQGMPFSADNMDMYLRLHSSPRINALLTGNLPFVQSSGLEKRRDRLVDLVPACQREKQRIHARNDAVIQAILDLQGGSVFLDASKDPFRMRFLGERHALKVIYLFKNGIAGAYSYYKRRRRGEATMEVASRRWFREQLAICRVLKDFERRNVLEISYSELCEDVPGTVDRVCQFLGIERRRLDNFAEVPHHIVGNTMRLQRVSEITESTDWQTELMESEIEAYRRVFGTYAKALARVSPRLFDYVWR